MTNETTETTMVTSQQQLVEASEPPKKFILPFFPNFNFQIPQFPFPPFPPKHHHHDHDDDKNKETPKLQSEGGQHSPNVVTFPKSQQVVVVPSVQTETDANNSTAKTSHPVILFQLEGLMMKFKRKTPIKRMVYAIGAYFLSRWILARWNERKARGGSPDDEGRGAQDNE